MKRTTVFCLCLLMLLAICGAQAETEPLRVMVYDRGNMPPEYGTPANNPWTEYIHTRVLSELDLDVTFVAVPRENDEEWVDMLLARQDAPDLLFTYSSDQFARLCESSLLADLTEPLAAYGDNLQQYLADVLAQGVYQGRQYAVPALRSSAAVTSGFIRKDWLDRVGRKLSTGENGNPYLTVDQLAEVLKAFQAENLSGLGPDAPAFRSYGTTYWPVYLILEAFLNPDSNTEEDLYTLPVFLLDGAKEGFRYLNRLVGEGLMNADFALYADTDRTAYSRAIADGEVGFWINDSWFGLSTDGVVDLLQTQSPDAEVVAVDLYGPSGRPAWKYIYNLTGAYIFSPAAGKHTEAAVRYLNWLATPEVDMVLRYGFENEHYIVRDGQMALMEPLPEGAVPRISVSDLDMVYNGCSYFSDDMDARLSLWSLPERLKTIYRQAYLVATDNTFTIPVLDIYLPEIHDLTEQLAQIEKELMIRTTLCTAEEFDGVWEEMVGTWKRAGGEKLMEIKRNAWKEKAPDR
ncbi:MAG: extracellular solute-binding protein [Clostridiales bacterium]|nr:extracellular solute-binding protein [Clostridiales bacterium]